jgi:hypothetical protein
MDNGEPKMGEMITDVGMDLDGVVYPFVNVFKTYCAERQGKLFLPDPVSWHFYEDWDMDEDIFHAWVRDATIQNDIFSTEKPYDGVVDAWHELRTMGIKIHVLTARPQVAWEQTAKWLTNNNLVADSLHFNTAKGFLTKISSGQSLIIDDHVQYYEEAEKNGIIPVLMNRPWNAHKKDATRVNNLSELVSLIRGYNLVKKVQNVKEKSAKMSTVTEPYIPDIRNNRRLHEPAKQIWKYPTPNWYWEH